MQSFSTASQKSWGPGRGSSSNFEADLEEIEDDPFHEAVEKLYEKRWVGGSWGVGDGGFLAL